MIENNQKDHFGWEQKKAIALTIRGINILSRTTGSIRIIEIYKNRVAKIEKSIIDISSLP